MRRAGDHPYALQEVGVRDDHAAFALHHFQDDGSGQRDAAEAVGECLLQLVGALLRAEAARRVRGEGAVGEEVDTGHPVVDRSFLRDQSADGHGAVRAAVEAATEGDDAPATGGGLAELEGRLDGAGSGGSAEVHFHPGAQARRQHGELGLGEGVLDRGGEVQAVGEGAELPDHAADDLRVVVAEGEDARAGEEVDEEVPVDVLDEAPRSLGERDGQVAGVGAGP